MNANLVRLDKYFAIRYKIEETSSTDYTHVNFTRLHVLHIQTLDRKGQKHLAVNKILNYDILLSMVLAVMLDNFLAGDVLNFKVVAA